MGHTHYWRSPKRGFSLTKWVALVKDARKILSEDRGLAPRPPVALEYDEPGKAPQIDGKAIRFNGIGDDGHETFDLRRVPDVHPLDAGEPTAFAFCKTECKPYDVLVCAVLLAARHHLGNAIQVASDGTRHDWLPGIARYEAATGRKAPNIWKET
jgi:hypothetical protein